ncbi:MAG: dihydroxyacetone kinase subunit L [Cyanosarcina radialis HA8281-LM2]|jgi:dihydroxyacetone kinase-like protein|nr:dihydroxyacetone kinase subunit L [Cyanosarcina radialis HA8281-LM2]
MNVTKQQILNWLRSIAQTIAQNKDYLTELDAAIGDADHGINLDRGFQKVVSQLPQVETQDLGAILKTVSMTLISSVGGASGPLYGTFFLRASTTVTGKEELTPNELADLLQAGVAGVVQRGRANLGDKTMLDALSPAANTFAELVAKGSTTVDALKQAVGAAETGMQQTVPLVAKKGRASYLGERSAGHQDPGATSSYLMLKTLLETISADKVEGF